MRLALYDSREGSPTKGHIDEFIISSENPMLVKIPKLVYHGFKCISSYEALVINVPTVPYNKETPDEFRIDPYDNDVPYNWKD